MTASTTGTAEGGVAVAGGAAISFGRRIPELANEHPDKLAIVFAPRSGAPERLVTWRELDHTSNRMARLLAERGIGQGTMLAVALPNCPEHFMWTHAGWKLGSCVVPISPSLPERERDQTLDAAQPTAVVAQWASLAEPWSLVRFPETLDRLHNYAADPLPDRIPHPGKSVPTGGSTGRSKIIIDPNPWVKVPGRAVGALGETVGFRLNQVQLITTRLYHNMPFSWANNGLFDDHTIVLMEHFDPAYALDLVERYRVNFLAPVPIIMRRLVEAPDWPDCDLSSIQSIFHSGAPCPPWVKRAWIDRIGAENVWEGFGGAEGTGATMIRGDDWLAHPDTVGKGFFADVRILDEQLQDVPVGTVGEIFMRPHSRVPTYRYLGAQPAPTTPDGFVSLGDLGSLDQDGYLHPADRRVDLIISGGANIYPAEVEAALTEHPAVADVAVIPVPDDVWGKRVHAVIQPRDPMALPSVEALDAHCRARIGAYKCPKSYEFLEDFPREPTGKIRRSAMAQARESGWTEGMLAVKSANSGAAT
jgi:bile acid-coenzyme A ligase